MSRAAYFREYRKKNGAKLNARKRKGRVKKFNKQKAISLGKILNSPTFGKEHL